ncbi:MAG: ATP synthase F0 subunit B [Myxococcota bacterium]|nr:ATP synthase F0 subunit B [Myxococcota bacterium]
MMAMPVSVIAAGGSIVDLDATLLIQLVIFLLVFLVLKQFLFRPVIDLIEARRKATQGTRSEATALEEEAGRLSDDVEKRLAEIRAEAGREREQMLEEAKRRERDIVTKARDDARNVVVQAKEEAVAQGETVREALKQEIVPLASAVTTKVVGRQI